MKRKKVKGPAPFQKTERQRVLDDLKATYPYYVLKSNLLGALFLVGLLLTVWEINIYRITFISVYPLLAIWIVTGLITTPFMKTTFDIYCFNPVTPGRTPLFFHLLWNIVSLGGIIIFLLMSTNQTLTDHVKHVITTDIVSRGHLAKSRNSCGEPYVHIIYHEKDKELIFPCGVETEKYSRVNIEVEKGLFGFDVITNKTLVEGQW